jgi:nucleotide-binding universal stress UspA family protein
LQEGDDAMSQRDRSTRTTRRPAPFEHLIVATDFSAGAGGALARAARLPLAERGRITVVHVLSDRIPGKTRAEAEKLARRRIDDARKGIARTLAARGRRDVEVSSDLCHGQPYVEIIRHARALGADLIVLGRHGRRPVRDMFIGSTAERVIRSGGLPVLVVNRNARRGYRRPLVAVDFEDTCRSVVTVALRVLGPEVTSAAMVHAYQVPFEGFVTAGARPRAEAELRKEYRQMAASGLDRIQELLGDLGLRWQTLIVRGDPRTAILATAVRHEADLLAVGTHGRSGIAHALLGSVAEWITQAAGCDVLVARAARVSFELP